jgi:hypothetical protein
LTEPSTIYERDLAIDETALDIAWLEQPGLMMKYCRLQAEAQRDMTLAKERQEYAEATINKLVRGDPDKYGVQAGSRGVTEDAIKAAVRTHPEYQKSVEEYIDAKYEYDVVSGAVRSFDHRKAALEKLVQLFGQSYFAGPQVPRNIAEEREMRDVHVQSKVRMRRR